MIPLQAVAEALADLGVVRVPGMWTPTLTLPGDRGDSIQIEFQHGPGSYGDQHEFYVNMSNCILPLTAYRRGETLEEARKRPPEMFEGVFQSRLIWPRGFPDDTWAITPATRERVLVELATELRRSLTESGCRFCRGRRCVLWCGTRIGRGRARCTPARSSSA